LRNPVLLEYEELKKLRYEASTDPLTGLKNRRIFEEYLHQEIGRSTRYGTPFALATFDLRNFKSANDVHGHAVGDDILRSFARASLETLRESDIPCRTGGDEFAILLPQAKLPGAAVMAERIARRFEGYARSLAPQAQVGIDYGIAIFPEDGHDPASLSAAADRCLYARKKNAQVPSEGPTVPPPAPAPTEEPGDQSKAGPTNTDVHRPPYSSSPAEKPRSENR
jgi:diguanylate cyclase (GGDEF)-like protein